MPEIPGLKVIYANTHRIDNRSEEDPIAMPWKLYANFRHGDFMIVTASLLYGGSEEIVLRADKREKIEEAVRVNEWQDHPRLRRLVLTLPDGTEELLAGTR